MYKCDPMKEFKNDPMMRRLHEFRIREYEATKNLSFKQIKEREQRDVKVFLKKFGYKLVDIGDGKSKMVKIKGGS